VPDPTALKALAHPVRLRMLGMLRVEGPATATQLAVRLGLNSGATSYHLRQLAQYGFIEEAPHPSRRDRWWRASHELTSVPASEAEGEALDLDLAFNQAALSLQVGQMQQALEEYTELPAEWRKANTASDI
ncbi:ArsR/SmtB family transcription factor, partial [Rhizobium leguminosarum]